MLLSILFGLLTIAPATSLPDAVQTPQNASIRLSEQRMTLPEWYDESVPSRVRRRLAARNGRAHFTSCWSQQAKGVTLEVKIGILVDNAYWRRLGEEKMYPHLDKIVAIANTVLADQMDILLVLSEKFIARAELRSSMFAEHPWLYEQPDMANKGHCGPASEKLSTRMRKFGTWVDNREVKNASFWILFTGCSYVEDRTHTLGRAMIGGFCTKVSRHGVVTAKFGEKLDTTTPHAPHTFTHEVGHLLGAHHTIEGEHPKWWTDIYEPGVTVYGIMSYAPPYTWKGVYQFHPIHIENICHEINDATLSGPTRLPYEACFSSSGCPKTCAGHLGDGVCNEECNILACNFDGADCELCKGCFQSMLGDGQCDDACNTKECNFDNQDCSCSANSAVALKCAQDFECLLNCGSKLGDALTRFIPLSARNELPPFMANSVGYWFLGSAITLLLVALSSWCFCCKETEPERPVSMYRETKIM